MSSERTFSRVGLARPPRSVFNLSYEKKFTADMGMLIPVLHDEMVPGDVWRIKNETVIRFQPLVAPILHEVDVKTYTFFTPYRLLWDEWEDFITGGTDGDFEAEIPTWNPTDNTEGSLWDYMGFPTDINPDGAYPIDFPRRAYNFIWNEYFRDQTLQDEVDLDNEDILNPAWQKDYFTSALPWQQRGQAPALPISGTTAAIWESASFSGVTNTSTDTKNYFSGHAGQATLRLSPNDSDRTQNAEDFFNSNTVDLSAATTFNVADLRLAFQIQRWLERNARAGARYTEFLHSHFRVSPRDERLQRPEFVGGTKAPVIVSEVLQTSSTDATTPQGNLAGHAITADGQRVGTYRAQEYGIIMTLFVVKPKPSYQQGINRQWLRRTKYDFYFPEFAHLSEQAILNAELVATDSSAHNNTIFGYQGRFDEMRYKPNLVTGQMRDVFDYWHLGRIFDTEAPPELNEEFIRLNPESTKRVFAVPSEPGMIISYANRIRATRPLPMQSVPGLIDH